MGEIRRAMRVGAEAAFREAPAAQRRALLAGELLSVVGMLVRRFRAAIPDALEAGLEGATPHQLEALHMLHHAHQGGAAGVTMNELARLQGCALSSASALADRLLREGLVERVADPDDRRVVRLVPTAKGDDVCTQFADVKRCVALQMMRRLSAAEMETLIALVRKATSDEPVSGPETVHG